MAFGYPGGPLRWQGGHACTFLGCNHRRSRSNAGAAYNKILTRARRPATTRAGGDGVLGARDRFRRGGGTSPGPAPTENRAAPPPPPPAAAAHPELRVFRPDNPYVALGLAVNHLMTK